MEHRTDLSQPDEALRQAQASTRELRTRAGLQWIAQRLATFRPTDPMTDNAREAAITRYVLDHHGDDHTANSVTWDLRDALPAALPTDTRAEYAARIQLLIQGVTA
ncbi:hypothetical protein ACN9M0_24865 [Streptomyces sp. R-07]|uniref:hypothetical protein n=1 Tax=Streptomyces sp. R-07 TaxID=3404052 RepID=UPI003CFACEE8